MQPESKPPLGEQPFVVLKNTLKRNVLVQRLRKRSGGNVPETLGIKLTNRCNLRCSHCYQWNESGSHHNMPRSEQNLDLEVSLFERILIETKQTQSRLYLWGGEPFVHRQISRILALLEENKRETLICTNAHLIGNYTEQICRISESLEFLIALEGFEVEHDALRGRGSFNKVIGNIEQLLSLRSEGRFLGKVSVHTVISDSMIGKLCSFLEFCEGKGVDLVLLCFPWYISDQTSSEMDAFVLQEFDWLIDSSRCQHSWDSFTYRIDPERVGALISDLTAINSRQWRTRIRYQPGLEFEEIEAFVRGQSMTPACATTCPVLSTRADITPDGSLIACKFFPEFLVGNLNDHSLSDIWTSETYDRIREKMGNKLSPACSKCSALYLHKFSTPMRIV